MRSHIRTWTIVFNFCLVALLLFGFSFSNAQVTITFEQSSPSPLTMNVGDEDWVRFDVRFSDNNFENRSTTHMESQKNVMSTGVIFPMGVIETIS